jgi:group I intron endonuclease
MNDTMSITKEKEVIWEEPESTTQWKNNVLPLTRGECVTITGINDSNESVPLIATTGTKIAGIYKIVNKINGKYYVGSSKDICGFPHGRWYQHKIHLRNNLHYNNHLQAAWNKYGEQNFDFVIIEILPSISLLEKEQYYLNISGTDKSKCYNQSFIAGRPEWTEEMKRRRSNQIRGKNNPNYGNQKICGKNNPFYGKRHSTISKQKMSTNHANVTGKYNSQYNSEKYTFYNIITRQTFHGTQHDFVHYSDKLKPSGISMLINGKSKSYKKWIVQSNVKIVEELKDPVPK